MATDSPDPYEQQLLAVFESCCCGDTMDGLDSKGLARLCEKLQLEDQAPRLIERLLGQQNENPITFPQFRDALLSVLGAHTEDIDGSPEREVRPKFVFGKKKYGRRSRPQNSQSSGSESDGEESASEQQQVDGELMNKRRKKGAAVECSRKCKPSADKKIEQDVWSKSLTEEEQSVQSTWQKLGAAYGGLLGQEELRLVCKAAGLEGSADELIERLFEHLGVEQEARVSFEQFLKLFRSSADAIISSPRSRDAVNFSKDEQPRSISFHTGDDDSSKAPLSLDTYTSGLASPEQVLALWEAGGVPNAASLLHDLGFGLSARRPISLAELSATLDEEARMLTEETTSSTIQPITCVLHASLVTQQAETKCLKAALEQVLGERDKLRQDVVEANERAALLAQEVDDRHARLEQASQQQARLQEQRHNEEIKALQAQISMDREQLAALTTGLELRLGQMQSEEGRLRTEVVSLTKRCEILDKDNTSLREQLSESEQLKTQLQWKVETLQQLELRLAEVETEQSEMHVHTVLPLQEKLETLIAENTALRDANDELTLKLEEFSSRNKTSHKQVAAEEFNAIGSRGVGKRRGRPGGPSSEESSDDDSPRLGKFRRQGPTEDEATQRLQERVTELERQLALCNQQHVQGQFKLNVGATESKENSADVTQQELRSTHIELFKHIDDRLEAFKMHYENSTLQDDMNGAEDESLGHVKAEIEKLLSAKIAIRKENNVLKETLTELSSKPELKGEQVLRDRINELESSLELMREEFDKCEDYWQGKLEEERKLYEQEQAATDERFSQLEEKIQEYEELLCQEQNSTTNNGRLSPIDESFLLEKQVTDLEEECEGLHKQLDVLSAEYMRVKQLLADAQKRNECLDAAVQTEPRQRSISIITGFSVRDKSIQVNQSNFEEVDGRHKFFNGEVKYSPPDVLRLGTMPREQSCRVQLNVMQSLTSKIQQQEQRSRRLEGLLAQQQAYADRLLLQHRTEVCSLQSTLNNTQSHLHQQAMALEEQAQKLAGNDVLIKELYVENARLITTVDRLERQCSHLASNQAAPGSA